MALYDASNAECHIYTYKEGVLSAIAHDLKIKVTSFRIDVSEGGESVVPIPISDHPSLLFRSERSGSCAKDSEHAGTYGWLRNARSGCG